MAGAAHMAEKSRRVSAPVRLGRALLIAIAVSFLGLLLLAPLGTVLAQALAKGFSTYLDSFADPDTRAAIRLTLLTAAIVVPLNTVFGICAAWAIAKFEFRGKQLVITLIDLPFSVSPVVAGLVYVLVFGAQGWAGPWFAEHGIKVIFAVPGIVLATIFVTFPFVARELIPTMQEQGTRDEDAALSLGASGLKTFFRITLPLLVPTMLFVVVTQFIAEMQIFGQPFVMTQGGPGNESKTVLIYLYQTAWSFFRMGYASAMAVSLALIMIVVTLIQFALLRNREA